MDTAKHCNFAGDECWNVRVLPVIDSLSASEGSVNGGQELKIEGFGFGGDAKVSVDGVDCAVVKSKSSDAELFCLTGQASGASQSGYQPGSPGLLVTTVVSEANGSAPDHADTVSMNGNYVRTTTHTTQFEAFVNTHEQASKLIQGFFRAPEDGRYRFHLSSDDSSRLFFDTSTPYDDVTRVPIEEPAFEHDDAIAFRWSACSWRNYFAEAVGTVTIPTNEQPNVHNSRSAWFDLEKGKYYPIEGFLKEYEVNDHMTV
jgi:hypothetical protein